MLKILYNGYISTLDDNNTIAQAIGIEDGKIVFVGKNQEALSLPSHEQIDLEGRQLLPGFVDSHLHAVHYAFVENSVKLFDCKSSKEALELVKKRVESDKTAPWIFCRGWNEHNFTEKIYPTKAELDEICSSIPIIMVRVCGHIAVSNTCGLEKLKKLKQFPEFESETNFETGLIKENAVQFYYSVLDKPKQEQVEELIKLAMQRLNQKGITGIQSDDLAGLPGKDWHLVMNAYNSLQEKEAMTVRVYEQCLFERVEDFKKFVQEGYRTGNGGEFFTIGPVKLLQDGALGAKTAAMRKAYEGEPENTGIVIFSQEELNEIVDICDKNDLQIAVHCIGDKAMDMVLDAIELSRKNGNKGIGRHGIVHAQITNQEILDKMKKENVIAYIQPVFVGYDMDITEERIGKHRMDKVYAWKTMLDMGIVTAGGSDAPVESFDVLENIYYAVTREKLKGGPKDGWLPDEKVSVDQAIKLFTKYPAYCSFTEKTNGTIEIGKRADLVILEENLYNVAPEKIKDVKVAMTFVNGKMVYKNK